MNHKTLANIGSGYTSTRCISLKLINSFILELLIKINKKKAKKDRTIIDPGYT